MNEAFEASSELACGWLVVELSAPLVVVMVVEVIEVVVVAVAAVVVVVALVVAVVFAVAVAVVTLVHLVAVTSQERLVSKGLCGCLCCFHRGR